MQRHALHLDQTPAHAVQPVSAKPCAQKTAGIAAVQWCVGWAVLQKLPVPCTSCVCVSQRFMCRDRFSILYVLIYGDNLHYEILHLTESPAGTNYRACKI